MKKKSTNVLVVSKNVVPLHSQNGNDTNKEVHEGMQDITKTQHYRCGYGVAYRQRRFPG